MAYFILNKPELSWFDPTTLYNERLDELIATKWLVYVYPGSNIVKIIARWNQQSKVAQTKAWHKSNSGYKMKNSGYKMKEIYDTYDFFLTNSKAEEISKEEATLILFEAK